MNLKKVIGKIYGLSRTAEEYLGHFNNADSLIDKLLNMIRSDCSEIIFNKEENELGLMDTDEDYIFTINILNEED